MLPRAPLFGTGYSSLSYLKQWRVVPFDKCARYLTGQSLDLTTQQPVLQETDVLEATGT